MDILQDTRKVFNLEVEDIHEFVANGVLVHNCNFPTGKDDQVDSASGGFNYLSRRPRLVVSQELLRKSAVPTRRVRL